MTREERDELIGKLSWSVAWKGMTAEERSRAEACAVVFLDALDDLGLKLVLKSGLPYEPGVSVHESGAGDGESVR